MLWQSTKQDVVKNFFLWGCLQGNWRLFLSALLRRPQDLPVLPSYRSIGRAVHMNSNTVRKYVAMLEEQRLIVTEKTSIMTKDGRKRNGSLLYTIRPIREAVEIRNQRLLRQLEETTERMRVAQKLTVSREPPRVTACEPLCVITLPPKGTSTTSGLRPQQGHLRGTKRKAG